MNRIRTRLSSAIHMGLATLVLALPINSAADEIYRHVDADGNVTFTDNPPDKDSKPLDLAPLPEVSLPDGSNRPRGNDEQREKESRTGPYEKVVIAQPEHDSAFWRGGGLVNINARSQPTLLKGHAYQLEFDGERRRRSRSGTFSLNNVDRGTHEIRVHIIDAEGNTIESSGLTRFTLHRPSQLN